MPETLNCSPSTKNEIDNIVASYEAKIENIDSFFETTHLIFNEFQEPLFDTKQEREEISVQLEDMLAENEHLRRTDFNRMMQRLLAIQVEKEKEIRDLLNNYLIEQKQMLGLLRDNLTKIKATRASGQGVEVKESKELISQILTRQDKRKQEVSLKLKEFQKGQLEMTQKLLELLAKGRSLRIRDLKLMLKEFDVQHKERIVQNEERKVEVKRRKQAVHDMLVAFKKKRRSFPRL